MRTTRRTVLGLAVLTIALSGAASQLPGRTGAEAAPAPVSTGRPPPRYVAPFDLTGYWEATFVWSDGHPTQHYSEHFTVNPTASVSYFGEPVYGSVECDLDQGALNDHHSLFAQAFVAPDGILMWLSVPGNGQTQSDGDWEQVAARSANTTRQPTTLQGYWVNASGPHGTYTLTRLSHPVLCTG